MEAPSLLAPTQFAGGTMLADAVSSLQDVQRELTSFDFEGGLRRVFAADVLLFCDVHSVEGIASSLRCLVELAISRGLVAATDCAVAVECVPKESGVALQAALADGPQRTREFISTHWGFAGGELADVLCGLAELGVTILPAGRQHAPLPPEGISDEERMRFGPHGEADFERCKRNVDETAADWLGRGVAAAPRKLLVLYGAAHVPAMRDDLTARGLKTAILFSGFRDWEVEVYKRAGAPAGRRWFEVLPGVYRTAQLTPSMIVMDKRRLAPPLPVVHLPPRWTFARWEELYGVLRGESPLDAFSDEERQQYVAYLESVDEQDLSRTLWSPEARKRWLEYRHAVAAYLRGDSTVPPGLLDEWQRLHYGDVVKIR